LILLISENVIDSISVHIINIIRYIWETEFEGQEVRFHLDYSRIPQQEITVYSGGRKVLQKTVSVSMPVKSEILIKKYGSSFVMELL
jgi:hypothetical protein